MCLLENAAEMTADERRAHFEIVAAILIFLQKQATRAESSRRSKRAIIIFVSKEKLAHCKLPILSFVLVVVAAFLRVERFMQSFLLAARLVNSRLTSNVIVVAVVVVVIAAATNKQQQKRRKHAACDARRL